jgi:hypothetical protein
MGGITHERSGRFRDESNPAQDRAVQQQDKYILLGAVRPAVLGREEGKPIRTEVYGESVKKRKQNLLKFSQSIDFL